MYRSQDEKREDLGKIAFGTLLTFVWLFLTAAVLSYTPWDFPTQFVYHDLTEIRNLAGLPGAWCAYALSTCFGVASYFLIFAFGIGLIVYWFFDGARDLTLKSFGTFLILLSLCGFSAYFFDSSIGPPIGPGGCVGALVKFLLDKIFVRSGSYVALFGVFLSGALLITPDAVVKRVVWSSGLGRLTGKVSRPFRIKLERGRLYGKPEYAELVGLSSSAPVANRRSVAPNSLATRAPSPTPRPSSVVRGTPARAPLAPLQARPNVATVPTIAENVGVVSPRPSEAPAFRYPGEDDVVARSAIEESDAFAPEPEPEYELPSLDLLLPGEYYDYSQIEGQIRNRASVLEAACREYKVDVRVVGYQTGPVLTMYEVELSKGMRVKQLNAIERDLAVRMAASRVRIVSPLPGKDTVGVELPNRDRQNVRLREVMEERLEDVDTMTLPIFLGKDVVGSPMVADLSTLPHLLIAGSTGTGKSVCLNTIIMSLLMSRSPEQVKMILIDPKMVELSPYKNIPHLMHPVVTDMEKAGAILEWAVEKMEARYKIMSRVGARNIDDFNRMSLETKRKRLGRIDEDEWNDFPKTMPSIVIVADEMADLIMTVGKDVERHIVRLAQKSRAVGIHLVLATQKPTRDVVTGLIKSNLPARISFQVASLVDSRVVLDTKGAEKLLGRGDMLVLMPGTSQPVRGQGAFVTDDEIHAVLDEINVDQPDYEFIIEDKKPEDEGEVPQDVEYDKYYIQCVETVIEHGKASASMLQRKYSIGYNRAARIIDVMTNDGIVSPPNPAKPSQPRNVLVTMEQWRGKQTAIERAMNPLTATKATPLDDERVVADSAEFDERDDQDYGYRGDQYENAPLVVRDFKREEEEGPGYDAEVNLSPDADNQEDAEDAEEELDETPDAPSETGGREAWSDQEWEAYLNYDAEIDGR